MQFKHHKFSLSFLKDIDKEKSLFFFPQILHSVIQQSTENALNSALSATEPKENKNLQQIPQNGQENRKEQEPQKSSSIPTLQLSIPSISNQGSSSFGSTQSGNKLINLPATTPKSSQKEGENAPKPLLFTPVGQSTGSSKQLQATPNPLEGLSLISIQKNISGSALKPQSHEQMKIEETKVGEEPGKEGKQARGFITSARSTTPPSESVSEPGQSSFRVNKIISSTIGGKPEKAESFKGIQKEIQPDTPKTGFKLIQKGGRGEEGLIPQKKVKLDPAAMEHDDGELGSGDKKDSGQKNQAFVLRPSPITK